MIQRRSVAFSGHELRKNCAGADSRRLDWRRVLALCEAISDATGHTDRVGLRSLRDDGFCTTDLSGEPARHRGVLVAIAKRELALPGSLHQVLQIVSISALEKVPFLELFTENYTREPSFDKPIQLEINAF